MIRMVRITFRSEMTENVHSARMISSVTLNSCLSIPGRPLGNDEIVIQIEALTEKLLVSEKPGRMANRA